MHDFYVLGIGNFFFDIIDSIEKAIHFVLFCFVLLHIIVGHFFRDLFIIFRL